jgi:hypothetical protein
VRNLLAPRQLLQRAYRHVAQQLWRFDNTDQQRSNFTHKNKPPNKKKQKREQMR